jgi:predicted transcriptional regulator
VIKLANLNFNRKIKKSWSKILNKNEKKDRDLLFHSLLSGDDITLDVCSFEEVLPYSLLSVPISAITSSDNVWIATSMLSRMSDITDNLVVVEDEFPIGTISPYEIMRGLRKNPTPRFLQENVTRIMNVDFYIDSRNINLIDVLNRMNKTKNPFTVIENGKQNFSQFSIKQILEIGALCKTDITVSMFPKKKIPTFKKEDKIRNVVELLSENNNKLILLENEVSFVSHKMVLDKIKDLNNTQNENILDLSASTFKTITPTLISEKLTLAEICKIMQGMENPYVMTSDCVITPYDILEVLCKEM